MSTAGRRNAAPDSLLAPSEHAKGERSHVCSSIITIVPFCTTPNASPLLMPFQSEDPKPTNAVLLDRITATAFRPY
jgi:hypothetical protein